MIAPVTQYCVYCKRTHSMSDARGPHNCPTDAELTLGIDGPLSIPLRSGIKIPRELQTRSMVKSPSKKATRKRSKAKKSKR